MEGVETKKNKGGKKDNHMNNKGAPKRKVQGEVFFIKRLPLVECALCFTQPN